MTTPIPVVRYAAPVENQVALQQPPQTFNDMQKKMENEMENRRMEWEKEVEKMQKDFFHLKPRDSADKSRDVAVAATKLPIRRHGTEIIDISNSKNLYAERPDGTKVYRLRFDVREFEPGEIHVKAEGHVLYLSAEHHDEFGTVKKVSKQFNRQMDLPEAVDPDKIEANLSSDGILTVEAPVDKIPEGEQPLHAMLGIEDGSNPQSSSLMYAIEGPNGRGANGSTTKESYKHFQGTTPGGVEVEVDPSNETLSYEHYISGDYDYPEYSQHYSSTEYPAYSQHVEYSMTPGYHVHHHSTGSHGGCGCPHPWSRSHQIHDAPPHNRMRTHKDLHHHAPGSYSYTTSSPAVRIQTTSLGSPISKTTTTTRYGHTSPSLLAAEVLSSSGSPKISISDLESKLEGDLSSNITSMISSRPTATDSIAAFGRYSNPLVVIVDGQRKLKLTVDIGTGFSPEEIEVTLKNNKIGINASHEETVPWSSKRNFSREWDLPEDIESRTLRAMLMDTGRIIIAASCKSNHDHDTLLESIKNDMPKGGQYCRIKIN